MSKLQTPEEYVDGLHEHILIEYTAEQIAAGYQDMMDNHDKKQEAIALINEMLKERYSMQA